MTDLNNLGTFDDIYAVWKIYPSGGLEGDYVTVAGTVLYWDRLHRKWIGEITKESGTGIKTVEGDLEVTGNATVDEKLTVKEAVIGTLEMEDPPYPTNAEFETLNQSVSGLKTKTDNLGSEVGGLSDKAGDYLSKAKDDSASGLITFLKGLCSKSLSTFEKGILADTIDTTDLKVSNQATIDKIVSSLFSSGQLGSGFTIYAKDGKSYMEVDELLVRMKAVFTSLEIRKLSYVGNNILLSSAGCKLMKVEETDTSYKCYFMADDGTTATTNDFVAGDQTRCQTFNIKAGKYTDVSNKYYWRLVTAVGDDYIELSKTDCDTNSDVPTAGDALVQLGNRTDSSRQNAIMLVVTGDDAPAFIQYKGINSYSLCGKDDTVISPSGNKFVAKSFSIRVGDETVKVPVERGEWIKDTPYSYYDRVSHNGSLWLCTVVEGKTTTEEPTETSTVWTKQVSQGDVGYRFEQFATPGAEFYNEGETSYKATLALHVFYNEKEITDTLPSTRFVWTRVSENTAGDPTWNELHESSSASIDITYQDLAGDTGFTCQFLDNNKNVISTQKF